MINLREYIKPAGGRRQRRLISLAPQTHALFYLAAFEASNAGVDLFYWSITLRIILIT